jgi:hypothetical protein
MRWKAVLGLAAVVTAVGTVGLVVVSRDGGNTTVNTNSCPTEGTNNDVACHWDQYLPDPSEVDAQKIIDSSRKYADKPPTGDGPWPFAVAGSDIGLKVRSSNVVNGEQLGGIQELHVAWVVCRVDSGWNPDPSTHGGSIWYQIRWTEHTPSTAYFESSPNADGTAWAYSGYLYPTGHNGQVPWCST